MKDIFGLVGILIVGFFLIQTSVTYAQENIRYNDLIDVMTETSILSAEEAIDLSSRVSRGVVYMDEDIYEETFEKNFNEKRNIALEGYSLDYDYKKKDDSLMAIRVVLTDDRGEEYTSTVVADVSKD